MNRIIGILASILILVTNIQAYPYAPASIILNQEILAEEIGIAHKVSYYSKVIENLKQATEKKEQQISDQITLSFAGDTTLGIYYGQGKGNRFDEIYSKEDDSYFFENVASIFGSDDLTIVNLEGPLTDIGVREEKQFAIKGETHYGNILKEGAIEVVNMANNHTYDYGVSGYERTKEILEQYEIGYFGEDRTYYTEINGIKVALIGAKGWNNSQHVKNTLTKRLELAKDNADLVVVMFHWGIERTFYPNTAQKDLAYHAIDQGADLIVGSHPHVIQGIEKYKGKSIVYSLGNFSFGANKNPDDKDTFIYQETFELTEDGIISVESKVIPCKISSVTTRNDYKPTPKDGQEGETILKRLRTYSKEFKQSYFDNIDSK